MAKTHPSFTVNTTFSAKNIATAASVYAFTAAADARVSFTVKLTNAAGTGDYVVYLTHDWLGAAAVATVLPKTTATAAAGETIIEFATIPIDVKATDVINVMVDGLAGDTSVNGAIRIVADNPSAFEATDTVTLVTTVTTLTNMPAAAPSAATNATAAAAAILATPAYKIATLSGGEIVISPETVVAAYLTSASSEGQQLIADAANNLAPASTGATGSIRAKLDAIKLITDAIDTSAVTVTSSNNAGVLTFTRGVTFAATVSGLTISGTWAKLYFTLKESDYDTDDLALIQIIVTNPAAGTDGLLYLDGSDIASPIVASDGTLTVSQVAGTVAIAITDNATVRLSKASGLVWDIKTKDAAGATVQNATGTASITQSVTQTI